MTIDRCKILFDCDCIIKICTSVIASIDLLVWFYLMIWIVGFVYIVLINDNLHWCTIDVWFFQKVVLILDLGVNTGDKLSPEKESYFSFPFYDVLTWIFQKLRWGKLCTRSDTCKDPTALRPP